MRPFLDSSKKSFIRVMSMAFALAIVMALAGGIFQVPCANAQDTLTATHITDSAEYTIGENLTVTTTVEYTGEVSMLGIKATLPDGWEFVSFVEASGNDPFVKPKAGDTGDLDFGWIEIPTSPVALSYTVTPKGIADDQNISASVTYARATGNTDPATGGTSNPVKISVTPELLSIQASGEPPVEGMLSISQLPPDTGYVAGGELTLAGKIEYSDGQLDALGVKIALPAGWTYSEDSINGDDAPANAKQTGNELELVWADIPATPIDFTYRVIPNAMAGVQTISATASYLFKDEEMKSAQADDLTVNEGTITLSASQTSGDYLAGSKLVIEPQIVYTGPLTTLGLEVTLPENWTYVSVDRKDGTPITAKQDGNKVNFAWADIPASPINFAYTVNVPAGEEGQKVVDAKLIYARVGDPAPQTMDVAPLTINAAAGETLTATHSADDYKPGETLTVTNQIKYTGTLNSLGFEATLPNGWTEGYSIGGDNKPESEELVGNTLKMYWIDTPASPIDFTYTLNVPADADGTITIPAEVVYGRAEGGIEKDPFIPDPLTIKKYVEEPPVTGFTIEAMAEGNGTISPDYIIYVEQGMSQTFTMMPNEEGYGLDDVLVDGVSVMADVVDNTYTFTNVNADHRILAVFKSMGILVCDTLENGTIIIQDKKAIIDSAEGYEVKDVQVNGVSVGSVAEYASFPAECFESGSRSAKSASAAIDECWWPGSCPDDTGDVDDGCSICATFETSPIRGENGPNGIVTVTVANDIRTATIIPDPDYIVDEVLVDGEAVELTGRTYVFAEGGDHTLLATFKSGKQYTIKATSGENGTINPVGDVKVDHGQNQLFEMVPDGEYTVAEVKVNGESKGALTKYEFENVTADGEIHVTFKPLTNIHTITATAETGGTIEPSGTVSVAIGGTLTFAIKADNGYILKDVTVNGDSKGPQASYTFENVTENYEIVAVFEKVGAWEPIDGGRILVRDDLIIIDSHSGYEVGDVMINGKSFGSIATYSLDECFNPGTEARSVAALDPCWWPGACEDISCSSDCCAEEGGLVCSDGVTLCANGDQLSDECADCNACGGVIGCMIYVKFQDSPITVTEEENGIVTVTVAVNEDETLTRTATLIPDPEYVVDVVTVDGEVAELVGNTYTFAEGEIALNATFKLAEPDKYTITATAGENGTIDPSGAVLVDKGANQTFTFIPADEYEVDVVTVNGEVQAEAGTSYTFLNIIKDQTINVTFRPVGLVYTITAAAGENGSISPEGDVDVVAGENQVFTITPDAGYVVDVVTVDGEPLAEAVTTYTFENVTEDGHTIEVTFKEAVQYEIQATSGANGSIWPSGKTLVDEGNSKTFTMSPFDGYLVEDVKVDGVSVGAVSSYTFSDVDADHTIYVTFKQKDQYIITATAFENGTIYPSDDVYVYGGTNQTFTMQADYGYAVDDVEVNGVSQGKITSYTFYGVMQNHNISVTFEPIEPGPEYIITATISGENGSISPSGEILVVADASQTFEMIPDNGYRVADVLVNGVSVGAVMSYTFSSMDADSTISVAFEKILVDTYDIVATSGANGNISPSGYVPVDANGDQTFFMRADDGYAVDEVLVDNVSVGAVADYTFYDVTEAHEISVSFKLIPPETYMITPSFGLNGTIEPSEVQTVNEGDSQQFVIKPADGYAVADVKVDGVSKGAITVYTFTDVVANHTIAATFKPSPEAVTYIVNASVEGNGTIDPSGEVAVYEGLARVFTLTPADGYEIGDVLVDGESVAEDEILPVNDSEGNYIHSTYTLQNVMKDQTISVKFKKKSDDGDDNCFITTAANGSGSSSVLMLMLMTVIGGIASVFLRRNM